ncbi:DUF362 domain-containing protein [bacterium]|nr:DUF362 domain-containing protein [bacterium]
MSVVSVVKCKSYGQERVDKAVKESLALIGGLGKIVKAGQRVLLKVNMLNADPPEKAVTTHPALLRSVIRAVKEIKGKVIVGESSGDAYKDVEKAWQVTGLKKAAEEEGVKVINFHKVEKIDNSQNKKAPTLYLAREALESDVVISLPKLKTHNFTLFSGAIKNLYGCIPGFHKKELHRLFPRSEDFAQLMVDIFSAINPDLAIMDAIVGMEGDGPAAGPPRKIGVVLASQDLVALDAVASHIIGYAPFDIDITRVAAERGLGEGKLEKIEIKGVPLSQAKIEGYQLASSINVLLNKVPGFVLFAFKHLAPWLLKIRPVIDKDRCTGCGQCIEHCPTEAMKMEKGFPIIDNKQCIRCFCCQEFCLQRAVGIKYNWLARKFQI